MGKHTKGPMLAFALLMAWQGCAGAEHISEMDAVRAILGEAEGEGFNGQYAVAKAIRNRGNLKGVYGHKAVIYEGGSYWRRGKAKNRQIGHDIARCATVAWSNSAYGPDDTFGATHWEGTAFKKPSWARGMVKTVTIGRQDFYREA